MYLLRERERESASEKIKSINLRKLMFGNIRPFDQYNYLAVN